MAVFSLVKTRKLETYDLIKY